VNGISGAAVQLREVWCAGGIAGACSVARRARARCSARARLTATRVVVSAGGQFELAEPLGIQR